MSWLQMAGIHPKKRQFMDQAGSPNQVSASIYTLIHGQYALNESPGVAA